MICQRQIIIILPAYLFRIGISNKILQKQLMGTSAAYAAKVASYVCTN